MSVRYALYFAPPPASPLEDAAAAWLGRNPRTGATTDRPAVPGITPTRLEALTAEARRYGFHATLKAPFRLAHGTDETGLLEAAAAFAAASPKFFMTPLNVGVLAGFTALLPPAPDPGVVDAAARCVSHFERFRAPLTAVEVARRCPESLSARQRAHLAAWGYPYVFDDYRFHMTLTGRALDSELAPLLAFLDSHFAGALALPLEFDAITVYRQPAPGANFHALARFELNAPSTLAV